MRKFTPEEDQYLRDNYLTVPAKRLSVLLNRTEGTARQRMRILGLVVPPDIIEKFKRDSRFKKGHKSFNRGLKQTEFMSADSIKRTAETRFKVNHKPHNTRADKVITIRKHKGVLSKWIRIASGQWQQLHHYNWLKAGHTIPEGFILVFKDLDSLNCEINNLLMITRAEHLKRNQADKPRGNNIKLGWRKRKDKDFAAALFVEQQRRRKELNKKAELKRKQLEQEEEKRKQLAIKAHQKKEQSKQRELEKIIQEKKETMKYKTKTVDLSKLIPLRIDAKTTVYLRPGQDPQKVIEKYKNRVVNF